MAAANVYVANTNSNTVTVLSTVPAVLDIISVGTFPVGVAVTPNLETVYVSNFSDNTVSIIDTSTNLVTKTLSVGNSPGGIVVTPDGTKVLVVNQSDGTVSVISTSTNTVVGLITLNNHGGGPSSPWSICISPDSSTAYVVADAGGNGWVEFLDIAALTDPVSVACPNAIGGGVTLNIQGICVSPDNSHVFVTGRNSGSNTVISTASQTVVGSMTDLTGEPCSICILPNGTKGFWTNTTGHAYVFNPTTFAIIVSGLLISGGDTLPGIASSADSTFLIISDASGGEIFNLNSSTYSFTSVSTSQAYPNGIGSFSYYPVPAPIVMVV